MKIGLKEPQSRIWIWIVKKITLKLVYNGGPLLSTILITPILKHYEISFLFSENIRISIDFFTESWFIGYIIINICIQSFIHFLFFYKIMFQKKFTNVSITVNIKPKVLSGGKLAWCIKKINWKIYKNNYKF